MYQQMYQTERYHLETLQQNVKQELKQIGQVRLAEGHTQHISILRQLLTAAGWRMVEMGTRLVERYSMTDCHGQRQDTHAAGLA